MSELKLITSEHFGKVEADIYSGGNDMFMTINQLATCLGYADRSGVQKLVDRNPYLNKPEFSGWDNLSLPQGGTQKVRIFTEDGIYEVTMLSGQPKAKEFRQWIRSILKALRRGELKTTPVNPLAQEIAEAKVNNSRACVSNQWLKIAQIIDVPEYKQICASYASNVLAGREVLPLPASEQRYLQAKDIGEMFGVSAQKIGKIANTYNLKTEKYGKWVHDKSPYSAKEVDAFRYNDKAVEEFKKILSC